MKNTTSAEYSTFYELMQLLKQEERAALLAYLFGWVGDNPDFVEGVKAWFTKMRPDLLPQRLK